MAINELTNKVVSLVDSPAFESLVDLFGAIPTFGTIVAIVRVAYVRIQSFAITLYCYTQRSAFEQEFDAIGEKKFTEKYLLNEESQSKAQHVDAAIRHTLQEFAKAADKHLRKASWEIIPFLGILGLIITANYTKDTSLFDILPKDLFSAPIPKAVKYVLFEEQKHLPPPSRIEAVPPTDQSSDETVDQ